MTTTPQQRLNNYRDARADLAGAVAAARDEGRTQQWIAAESGLSREGVRKILNRQETPVTALIETDASIYAASLLATEVVGAQVPASQTGRLGTEIAVSTEHLDAVTAALEESGHQTIVTIRK